MSSADAWAQMVALTGGDEELANALLRLADYINRGWAAEGVATVGGEAYEREWGWALLDDSGWVDN